MTESEPPQMWTIDEVADYLGVAYWAAHKRVERAGIRPIAREAGKTGRNLYDAATIRERWPPDPE